MSNSAAFEALREKDFSYFWHPGTQMAEYIKAQPQIMARGEGYRVWDFNDKEYIDGNSGVWCVNLGYGQRRLIDAATKQLSTLPYSSLFAFVHEPAIELCARLVQLTPGRKGKAFLVTDGSEAIDTAIKMARQFFHQNGQGQRQIILSNRGSYHGLSLGALSVSGMASYRNQFGPLLPGFYQVPIKQSGGRSLPCAEALAAEVAYHGAGNIAAIVIEPIMASGGIVVPSDNYLHDVAQLAKRAGALLVMDEVTTGFGRTGKMFAFEHAGIEPDIIAVSKGLTSGYLPLGAVIASDALYDGFLGSNQSGRAFSNAYTYGGHPVSCAVALATLDVMEEEAVLDNVDVVGRHLHRKLCDLKESTRSIGDIRGLGLLYGIELVDPSGMPVPGEIGKAVSAAALADGLIIRALGSMSHVLVLVPPLILDIQGADRIVAKLAAAIDRVITSRS